MKVLITGGTHGMGKGVALALAARPDVELVILGRSAQGGQEVCVELSRLAAPERISFVRCDLSRLRDVRAAITEVRARHPTLDAIFINAGIGYAPRRAETEDGMLEHFQVNYLSQFMLTLNLLELLEASALGGRVIFNTASFGQLNWDDVQLKKQWSFEAGVGLGMVAKHMFCMRLHQLYAARGTAAVSCFGFSIPKTVWSNQVNIIPFPMKAAATVMKWFGQFISIEQCGQIMAPLFLDSAPATRERSGRFLTWKEGNFVPVDKNPASLEPSDWERLWDLSLDLCADEQTRRCAARLVSSIGS